MTLQLDDELTCSVCLELYDCPLTLPCLHTFCSECLRELTQSSNGLTIVCPQCRVDTPIPIGGVGKFPKNFNLENIIHKLKLHKEKEGSSNTDIRDPTQANTYQTTRVSSTILFCEQQFYEWRCRATLYTIMFMDPVMQFVDFVKTFVKDSFRLVQRCTTPNVEEFLKIAVATVIGFAILGFIGFFVRLIHIPINNIIVGS
ncbi:uncharacterized protein LOC144619523 [Crassostrea virginica]